MKTIPVPFGIGYQMKTEPIKFAIHFFLNNKRWPTEQDRTDMTKETVEEIKDVLNSWIDDEND